MITDVVLKAQALWLLLILCAQADMFLGWMGSAALKTTQNCRSGTLNDTSGVWKVFAKKRLKWGESSLFELKNFTQFCLCSTVCSVQFGRTQLVPPVCPMARSSPRGHTLLLCSCSVLIFREQLFQRINTLPCRRNSRKHPATDSGSRCPSSWTFLCQKQRGFVSWPAKGWELQTLYSLGCPKEITFQSAELNLWRC